MSVVITNISTHDDMTGINQYTVAVGDIKVSFEHAREKGLAECLRDAADAVDRRDGKLPPLGSFRDYLRQYKKVVDRRIDEVAQL